MNIAQQILIIMLKMMHYDEFKSGLTPEEEKFVESVRKSSLKNFRISTLNDRQMILVWKSNAFDNDNSAACYAGEKGFFLSETTEYKRQTKNMKDRENISSDSMKIMNAEIEEIKKIFRKYSKDVEKDVEAFLK